MVDIAKPKRGIFLSYSEMFGAQEFPPQKNRLRGKNQFIRSMNSKTVKPDLNASKM